MLAPHHDAAEVVFGLALVVLLATGTLVSLVLLRRHQRQKHFAAVDHLRENLGAILDSLLRGEISYAKGLAAVQAGRRRAEENIFEALFEEKLLKAANIPVLRQLAADLGFVGRWQRRLQGDFEAPRFRYAFAQPGNRLAQAGPLSFLVRAKSAEFLGLIRHRPSWPLLVRALDDRHQDVRAVAARSLGLIAEPASFPALVKRLRDSLEGRPHSLSIRHLQSAMSRFPLEAAPELLPCLDHAHPRVRFAAADIILKMIERPAGYELNFVLKPALFPPALVDCFLDRLVVDPDADVRGRAALVIPYLEDPRVIPALWRLTTDSVWFVRLHAVRALGRRRRLPEITPLARCLTDAHWRVREAAAQALARRGSAGFALLLEHFVTTPDRYSREQVAEQMGRSGFIASLLRRHGEAGGREFRAIQLLIETGKTNAIRSALAGGRDEKLELLSRLKASPHAAVQSFVRQWAGKPRAAYSVPSGPAPAPEQRAESSLDSSGS